MKTRNKNDRNINDCETLLKLFDYYRKSDCTHSVSDYKHGSRPLSPHSCQKTTDEMKEVAKECIELTGYKFK